MHMLDIHAHDHLLRPSPINGRGPSDRVWGLGLNWVVHVRGRLPTHMLEENARWQPLWGSNLTEPRSGVRVFEEAAFPAVVASARAGQEAAFPAVIASAGAGQEAAFPPVVASAQAGQEAAFPPFVAEAVATEEAAFPAFTAQAAAGSEAAFPAIAAAAAKALHSPSLLW